MKQKIYKVLSIVLTLAVVLSCCMCTMGTTAFAVENATSQAYLNLDNHLSLTWSPDNAIEGSSSGTYTLSASNNSAYGTYKLYYADEDGILAEYAPIAEFSLSISATRKEYSGMIEQNVLPVGATRVVAVLNGEIKAYADIPVEKQFNPGELIYTHAVFSDAHVFGDKSQWYNGYDELPVAIETIQEMGAEFLSISGDFTYDDGLGGIKEVLDQYEGFEVHGCTGNHDVGISDSAWLSYWGHNKDYSFTYKGETFIYLSLSTSSGYSSAKIDWLAEEMEKAAGTRIYLFMHFPFPNYAGLLPGATYGFPADSPDVARIIELIRKYDNTYVFSGHTHYNFDSQSQYPNITVKPIEGTNSYTVHTPSLAYPRLSNGVQITTQSQGFLVEVYEDGIVLKGVDFKNDKKPIPSSCYYLESQTSPYYLNEASVTMLTGESKSLQILGEPYDNAVWSSSNANVVSVDGNGNITAVSRGQATITAVIGEYAIRALITVKDPPPEVAITFYIDNAKGKDDADGLSVETAVKTLSKAMELAVYAGAEKGHTVNFKFIGTSASYNAIPHDFTAILSSNNPTSKATMKLGTLQGETILDNISISNAGAGTLFNDMSLTINSTTSAGFWNDTLWVRAGYTETPQKLVFEQAFSSAHLYIGQEWNNNLTIGGDLTLVIDNDASYLAVLALGIGSGNIKFDGNLNFDFKDMDGIGNFLLPSGANFKKGFQIINSSDFDFATTYASKLQSVDSSKLWVLNNTTKDLKDALKFTETAGKYIVVDGYTVTATKGGDETVTSAYNEELGANVLDLTALGAGQYSITVEVHVHEYDNCEDTTCNTCGSVREPVEHKFDGCEDTQCNNCDKTREALAHAYDDCEDTVCNNCGDTRVAPGHKYDNCEDTVCNNCGEVREPVEHEYDNCEDTQCNNCEATREALVHAYDDCEDTICNNCGDTRVAPGHKYDNCEDTVCNNCGDTRTAVEHIYDNCEDTTCNNCDNVREALEHQYTDCEDTICNNCDYVREALEHEYDDATDVDCNNCGAIRELRSGWVLEDGNWYYYENGAKKTGWLYNSNQWYYLNGEGVMVKGWLNLNGTWYYLDTVYGQMVTGWLRLGNTYYYLKASGAMATGWLNVGGTWYYLNASGAMATGWLRLGNTYYYLKPSGAMATGWLNVGGTWYYLNASGAMATGWLNIGGNWYYLQGSGAMATGWLRISGNWYYFYSSGLMAKNIYISGGYIDQYGIWR